MPVLFENLRNLDADVVSDLDNCREGLIKLIEDNQSPLKDDQRLLTGENGVILLIDPCDQREYIEKKIKKSMTSISCLLDKIGEGEIKSPDARKKGYEFLLLLHKRYDRADKAAIKTLENIVEILNSGKPLTQEIINKYLRFTFIYDNKTYPYWYGFHNHIVFDLLLEGTFNNDSMLYRVIFRKTFRNYPTSWPGIKEDNHDTLKFKFDDSINVQLVWALFSLLGYHSGKSTHSATSTIFVEYCTKAFKDQRSIDFHSNDDFISFLCMRTNSFEDIENLFYVTSDAPEFFSFVRKSSQEQTVMEMEPTKRAVFLLKSFCKSEKLGASTEASGSKGKGKNHSCLYEYIKERVDPTNLIGIIKNRVVNSQARIENLLDETENLIAVSSLAKRINEMSKKNREHLAAESSKSEIAERAIELNLEIEILNQKKTELLNDIIKVKLKHQLALSGLTEQAIQECTDPVTLEIMENAVSTKYGHSFDRESISLIIRKTQQQKAAQLGIQDSEEISKIPGECPMTRQELKLIDLFPNFSLRKIIDSIPEEVKKSINSGAHEIISLTTID